MSFDKFYIFILTLFFCCTNTEKTYLNINESVSYVGMQTCASCHSDKHNSFLRTGMGKSFRPALKEYSSSFFNHTMYDSTLNFFYYPHWNDDTIFIEEYSLKSKQMPLAKRAIMSCLRAAVPQVCLCLRPCGWSICFSVVAMHFWISWM